MALQFELLSQKVTGFGSARVEATSGSAMLVVGSSIWRVTLGREFTAVHVIEI